jgi:hypothetical protein
MADTTLLTALCLPRSSQLLIKKSRTASTMMADDVQVDDEVPVAQATPLFPPRPDAIATLITSDDFLPGAQTLLYSVKVSCYLLFFL